MYFLIFACRIGWGILSGTICPNFFFLFLAKMGWGFERDVDRVKG